jgi:hypothetical protein
LEIRYGACLIEYGFGRIASFITLYFGQHFWNRASLAITAFGVGYCHDKLKKQDENTCTSHFSKTSRFKNNLTKHIGNKKRSSTKRFFLDRFKVFLRKEVLFQCPRKSGPGLY